MKFDPKWNLDIDSLNLIKILIQVSSAKNVLEIGTFNGHTAIELSKYCHVTTIEKDQRHYDKLDKEFNNNKNITLLKGDAKEIIKTLKKEVNIIFIDAVKREYIEYIKLLEQQNIITKNTIIIADNVISHKEKVQDYLDYVKEKYNSITIDIGKGLEMSKVRDLI